MKIEDDHMIIEIFQIYNLRVFIRLKPNPLKEAFLNGKFRPN